MKAIKIIRAFIIDFIIIIAVIYMLLSILTTEKGTSLKEILGASEGLLIIIFAALLAGVEVSFRYIRYKQGKQELELLSQKLNDITEGKKPGHILLEPSDPLYEISRTINRLENRQHDFTKNFTVQQRGYFSLIEYLTIGVMILDQDRKIYMSNHAMSDLMGREMNLQGQIYINEIRTYDLSRLIEAAFSSQEDQHSEIRLDLTDKVVDAHVVYVPVSKHRLLVMVLLYDITELKEIERMQLDFVGNVSHELKTPITAITGFSETLLQGAMEDKQALKEFLAIIHKESLKLTELVEDILSLARIDANTELNLKEINLRVYVAELLKTFKPQLEKKKIMVFLEISEKYVVSMDQNKLRHVIDNLIQNAIKYNSFQGKIWIDGSIDEKSWSIGIRDNGYGISQDKQERIFERFYRIDASRSRDSGGTGLGLSVVKEYVAAMNGEIMLESQVGVGSKFIIKFPIELDVQKA
ncbi:two-component system histidine kinase PnpS [Lactobacillus sp. UCMA15818]|uniref:two-component system histidine kinase PnpS n=1 Tax=Lactobacillus sp. UCMA15818 TaxID=2583394 RepID=UPI0025B00AE5|nr:ATP-binding protein [Lactobacillus sp. UCMA15818]